MHFPLFIELEGRPCLVVGGGPVAVRKAQALAECGAKVTVVAGTNGQDARSTGKATGVNGQDARSTWEGSFCGTGVPPVHVVRRNFTDGDVEGMSLVVSATNDRAVNRCVAELCRARGVPVNVVDDPANCTFIFPAVVRKGPMTVAVSSGGACPVAAKMVRDKVAGALPDDFVAAVERLGNERENLKRDYPDPQVRRRVCEEALKRWKD